MNQSQFTSFLKTSLGALGGVVTTYATLKGVDIPAILIGPEAMTFYAGVLSLVTPYVWGWFSHTNLANIQTAALVPQVSTITIKSSATDGIAAAAADPTQPKIVRG